MQQRIDEPYPPASARQSGRKIHQRHDKFLRFVFKDEQRCADISQDFGPKRVAKRLADGPAKVLSTTFTSKFLRGSECDARYEMATRDGRPRKVQWIVEFQSAVDRFLIVRILGYVVSALFEWVESDKGDEAPAIVPMILYTGDGNRTASYSLAGLIPGLGSLGKYVLSFFVYVLDFSKIKPEQLIGRNADASACLLGAYFASAKRRAGAGITQWLRKIFGLPKAGSRVLVPLAVYIQDTYDDVPKAVIEEAFLAARPVDGVELLATASQEIVAEAAPGIVAAAAPGIEARMLTRTLERRFGPVPEEFRQRISEADERDVDRWMDRFYKADSLDQIFNGSGED